VKNKNLKEAAGIEADKGWQFRKKGAMKRALDSAQKALSLYPDHVDALNLLGIIFLEGSEIAKALGCYKKGLDAALSEQNWLPKLDGVSYWDDVATRPYLRARYGYALCLFYQGMYKDALDHFLVLLDIDPQDNMGVAFLLGDLYHFLADLDAAEKWYKQCESSKQTLFGYGLLLFRRGKLHEARILLKKVSNALPHTKSMLESYLYCFALWETMGSYIWGMYPDESHHKNALNTAWNKALLYIEDESAYAGAKEAINYCKLCGPLWLSWPDSFDLLKDGITTG
jgi:tetratricopeptide (TPR) repeat protein